MSSFTVESIPDDKATILASQPEEQRIAYEVATVIVLLKNEKHPADHLNKVKNIAVIQNTFVHSAGDGRRRESTEITPQRFRNRVATEPISYARV